MPLNIPPTGQFQISSDLTHASNISLDLWDFTELPILVKPKINNRQQAAGYSYLQFQDR